MNLVVRGGGASFFAPRRWTNHQVTHRITHQASHSSDSNPSRTIPPGEALAGAEDELGALRGALRAERARRAVSRDLIRLCVSSTFAPGAPAVVLFTSCLRSDSVIPFNLMGPYLHASPLVALRATTKKTFTLPRQPNQPTSRPIGLSANQVRRHGTPGWRGLAPLGPPRLTRKGRAARRGRGKERGGSGGGLRGDEPRGSGGQGRAPTGPRRPGGALCRGRHCYVSTAASL